MRGISSCAWAAIPEPLTVPAAPWSDLLGSTDLTDAGLPGLVLRVRSAYGSDQHLGVLQEPVYGAPSESLGTRRPARGSAPLRGCGATEQGPLVEVLVAGHSSNGARTDYFGRLETMSGQPRYDEPGRCSPCARSIDSSLLSGRYR